jgi:hypothetical protein
LTATGLVFGSHGLRDVSECATAIGKSAGQVGIKGLRDMVMKVLNVDLDPADRIQSFGQGVRIWAIFRSENPVAMSMASACDDKGRW